MAASEEGHLPTVELLLSAGADPHHCNNVTYVFFFIVIMVTVPSFAQL